MAAEMCEYSVGGGGGLRLLCRTSCYSNTSGRGDWDRAENSSRATPGVGARLSSRIYSCNRRRFVESVRYFIVRSPTFLYSKMSLVRSPTFHRSRRCR